VAGSRLEIRGVSLNPTRTGILDVLDAMGARVERREGPPSIEPAGTLVADGAELRGTMIAGALIPRLIDEVPVLAVAAAVAGGRTEIRDAAELRVKESDRVAALARELGKMGARLEERPDGLLIAGGARLSGARVTSDGDHRVAMALAVAGLVADGETIIEDTACIATSFPEFAETLGRLAPGAVTVEP